ncbi:unnamed protein product [Ixodes hexagonus]
MDKLAHCCFRRVISRNLLRRGTTSGQQSRGQGTCLLKNDVTARASSSTSSCCPRPVRMPAWGTRLSICQSPAYSTDAGMDAALLEKLCVDFAEVESLLKKGTAYFVDVREPNELVNDGRIRGAVNIPLNDVGTALSLPVEKFKEKYGREKPSPDDPNLIFSCRKGVRATKAMQTAHSKGYQKARFYRGSFCDWVEKGGEVLKQ